MIIPILIVMGAATLTIKMVNAHLDRRDAENKKATRIDFPGDEEEVTIPDLDEIYEEEDNIVWCEGIKLRKNDPKSLDIFFKEIKPRAYLEQQYNSKNLDEGGEWDLMIAQHMLTTGKGRWAAEQYALKHGLEQPPGLGRVKDRYAFYE